MSRSSTRIRCSFCGRLPANDYACPRGACDGVALCDRCLSKRRYLCSAQNHRGCQLELSSASLRAPQGEVGETSIVEVLRRCGQHHIRAAGIFEWLKLRWMITSCHDDDLLLDALAYCERKKIRVSKLILADGQELELSATGATVMARVFELHGWEHDEQGLRRSRRAQA